MTRVIIAGSRDIDDYDLLLEAIKDSCFEITEVVSGACLNKKPGIELSKGVDGLGERYAGENNLGIRFFVADWDTHGKAAGPIRNAQMADYADALICIYKTDSRGSKNMIRCAREQDLEIYTKEYDR